MTLPAGFIERRRHARVTLKGTVLLDAGVHVLRGRIVNIAHGGIFVSTTVTAPLRLLGSPVSVDLRLDAGQNEWMKATGTILRVGTKTLAVSFLHRSPSLVRLVSEMVDASRTRRRRLAIVLVDGDRDRRALIAEGFRAVGCLTVEAATPLEAIVRLGESRFEPDLIAVGDSTPQADAAELRAMITREHPNTTVVTITNDAIEPQGVANWLSSGNLQDDLIGRIRDLLVRPRRAV